MIQHVGGSYRSNDPRSLLCLTAAECALVDEGIRTGWDAGDHCCSGGGCQRITTGGRRRDEGQRPEKAAGGSRQNAHSSKASHDRRSSGQVRRSKTELRWQGTVQSMRSTGRSHAHDMPAISRTSMRYAQDAQEWHTAVNKETTSGSGSLLFYLEG